MHPILINIGGLYIHSYGVMLAIGFMVGISLSVRESRRVGMDPEKILNLSFYVLFAAIAGSRLFHCIVYYDQYLEDPLRVLKLWEGGLVFYGGFLGAALVSIFYTRAIKTNYWEMADIVAPGLAVGLACGRIGCFLAGCCFGAECGPDFPFAITFTNPLGLGIKDTPLYPTQLMSAANAILLFLILWALRKKKTFHGMLFGVFLFYYAITRSLIELLRADPRGFVDLGPLHISESQLVSVAMFVIALYLFTWNRNRNPVEGAAIPPQSS